MGGLEKQEFHRRFAQAIKSSLSLEEIESHLFMFLFIDTKSKNTKL
jgi:hypothetical protein